jgi:cytoskeletal protein RodZ
MATHLSFPSPDPAPQPAPPERKAANLGDLLRSARERRRLTLQQVSDETKIPLRYLEALERNDLDALPNGLYRRAQVRAYARAVRMDPRLAIERLERDLKAAAPVSPAPEPPPRRESVVMPRNRVIIGIGLLLAAALVGHVLGRRGPATVSEHATTSPERRSSAVAPVARDAVVATSLRTSSPAPAVTDAAPAVNLAPAVKVETAPAAPQAAPVPAGPADPIANPTAPSTTPQTTTSQRVESGSQLIVTSEPAGARVTVDGIGWGTTPVTIRYIPPGDKKVRVSRDGYAAAERIVHVDTLQQKKVAVQLRQVP